MFASIFLCVLVMMGVASGMPSVQEKLSRSGNVSKKFEEISQVNNRAATERLAEEEVQGSQPRNFGHVVSYTVEEFYVEVASWEDACYVRPLEIVSLTDLPSDTKLFETCGNTTAKLSTDRVPASLAKFCAGKQLYALDKCGEKHDTGTSEEGREKRGCEYKLLCQGQVGFYMLRLCGEIEIFGCEWRLCCSW